MAITTVAVVPTQHAQIYTMASSVHANKVSTVTDSTAQVRINALQV